MQAKWVGMREGQCPETAGRNLLPWIRGRTPLRVLSRMRRSDEGNAGGRDGQECYAKHAPAAGLPEFRRADAACLEQRRLNCQDWASPLFNLNDLGIVTLGRRIRSHQSISLSDFISGGQKIEGGTLMT